MRKMARGGPENQDPTAPGQMMSMDFGFMFHKSKNSAHAKKLTGINGGTSYCLIHDAYTGLTFLVTTSTKQPPIAWVMVILTRLNCKHPRKFIRMDGGGELAKSHAMKKLLQRLHYLPEVTGAYSSSQNDQAECPHQDMGNMSVSSWKVIQSSLNIGNMELTMRVTS